jgi:hypothetical protein
MRISRITLAVVAVITTGGWQLTKLAPAPKGGYCDCEVCDGGPPADEGCEFDNGFLQCVPASSFLPCMTQECDPEDPCWPE